MTGATAQAIQGPALADVIVQPPSLFLAFIFLDVKWKLIYSDILFVSVM
jgi:hypothetical protein